MANEYASAVKTMARRMIAAPIDGEVWGRIIDGVFALVALFVYIIYLLTFPISMPLLAWLHVADSRKRKGDVAVLRQRMRDRIHKNGA